ncbi:TraX family protein [Xanthomonas vesicatoria]|nr:TraX family protein [Xanthomonas vesicatoria]
MTGDHVNKYLFNATLPVLFEAGRVALLLFVFVLAYNLARPGTLERGVYGRTMSRLAVFGAVASVPFVALGGLYAGWWPLNVMFTLLVVTATAYLVERGGKLHLAAAGVVFLVGGSSVEYWWPAVAFGLAVWSYTRRPSWAAAAVAVLACAALWFINRNLWALAALPVLFLASRVDVRLPRLRWAFYAYYPLHLAALWLIRIPMSKAGYLFF